MSPPIGPSPTRPTSLRRIGAAALVALSAGMVTIVLGQGLSSSGPLKVLEELGLGVLVIALLVGGAAVLAVRMGGWRDPESEAEFEALVVRAERLAAQAPVRGKAAQDELMMMDPLDDDDFEELVRDALDDLPDLLRNALAHVAVVISDAGRVHNAYGLYQGDGAHRDDYPDRIMIFRDTLRRDFGHDPVLLRDQVTRTVRHELAHHVGFDELGVSRLDL
jgi:predicted Zn-dependent protease with MMP-like domain